MKRAEICRSCRTYDCIRGNETSRGCELYLFQPRKTGNLDCTFCMDCVKACPHDNVSLVSIAPAKTLTADSYRSSFGRLSKRSDIVALSLLIVFGAFVNAAGMVSPIAGWEHSMPAGVALFVLAGVVICPFVAFVVSAALNTLTGVRPGIADFARRSALALVPVGVAMWAAHLLYHLATSFGAAWPAMLRAATGSFRFVTMPVVPNWLAPAQILLLDAGLLLTLYIAWRVASQHTTRVRTALALVAPWAAVSCALYAAGIWILFQPMQMRGMLH